MKNKTKEFDNASEFWKEAEIGDELKAGIIKKENPLFEKVYLCPECKKDNIYSLPLKLISPEKFKCLKCNKEFLRKEIIKIISDRIIK